MIVPFYIPLQETLVDEMLTERTAGFTIVTQLEAEQAFASETDTQYSPAHNPSIAPMLIPFDQL